MLSKERLVYIVQRLQVRPSISVRELSKEMKVSLSTAQRDLRKLEEDKKIERSRGGAMSNAYADILSGISEVAVSDKVHLNQAAKDVIAKRAADVIKEGECIFLDSGTSVAHMAPYILNKRITIVTNSHYVLRTLGGCKGEIYMLGGVYNAKYDMSLGAATISQMENMRFDRIFLSASGVDLRSQEVYSVESEIAIIKQWAMKRTRRAYLMVDDSKFRTKAVHTYAKIPAFEYVFTNAYPADEKKYKTIVICK